MFGVLFFFCFFFSSRRRHTRLVSDWSSDVCSSDLLNSSPHPWWQARVVANVTRHAHATVALTSMPTKLDAIPRSEEHTSELQSLTNLVCRLLLEKKKKGK